MLRILIIENLNSNFHGNFTSSKDMDAPMGGLSKTVIQSVPVPGVLAFKTLSKKVIKFIRRFLLESKIENTEG